MTPLLDYLLEVRQAISAFSGARPEQYREQLLTATRANVRDAPHHPEIETFPHYKHIEETAVGSCRPDLPALLAEIQHLLPRR